MINPLLMYILAGGGVFVVIFLVMNALMPGGGADFNRRLVRVGPEGKKQLPTQKGRTPQTVRQASDTGIPILNFIIRFLPNPEKLRTRLAKTGKNISLGEYVLITAVSLAAFNAVFRMLGWSTLLIVPMTVACGLGLPHFVIGVMGNRRLKKFIAAFPEAIDTMCRGLRSGLPVTESIAAVGREMPDPIGTEFHRISDGIRMGKTLESSMWEVAKRIDTPEYRFLIIAMAIQKETGGNLAETLGNLSDLIRRRRALRLKIKAMSSEAKASAMIIGSLPFLMFMLLMAINSEYMGAMLHTLRGKIMLGLGLTWMSMGWFVMSRMIAFKI